MKELNENNFDKFVIKSKGSVLVDFWSEYCLQCEALKPTMDKLEKKYTKVKFYSANISETSDIATIYGILSLPTIIIFKNGEIAHQLYGNLPQDVFEKELDKL